MFPYRKVLFKLTGSIAAFKACALISRLVKEKVEVQIVASPSALKFIGTATLEGLTGKKVFSEVFAEGQMMNHIHLDRWADAVILCPATANTINQMAAGIADDLVKNLYLAHDFKRPYFLVPAMNEKMWSHPATKKSVESLKAAGVQILNPTSGSLACGEEGEGRMLEADEIYARLASAASGPRVLITSGGTREAIDSVRFIGNMSTGSTAAAIADELIKSGFRVSFLKAQSSVSPHLLCAEYSFVTFADLKRQLASLLTKESFDYVIHAAAVSDYSVAEIKSGEKKLPKAGKIDSAEKVTLTLKKNPKLIDDLKEISRNKKIKLIGFKLTDTDDLKEIKEAVKKLFAHSDADFVVHNDLSAISREGHKGNIYSNKGRTLSFSTKRELANRLKEVIL